MCVRQHHDQPRKLALSPDRQREVFNTSDKLKLLLFVDADFCGETGDTRSTSGAWLVLAGPDTWFPLAWVSRRQTSTSRSTTEAEIVAFANALFAEALPMLELFTLILGRNIPLIILEDNQATIKIVRKGFSAKLCHVARTHKIDLSSIKDVLDHGKTGPNTNGPVHVEYCHTNFQVADVFTKALPPLKWDNALRLGHRHC